MIKYGWIFCLLMFVTLTSCEQEKGLDTDVVTSNEKPVLSFKSLVHDFETIEEGLQVLWAFEFTNTGKSDLIITDAKGSCGCIVPNYTKEPVAPGESGIIEVKFDSAGKKGQQEKVITIQSNAVPPVVKLKVLADVQPKKNN
ncbi:MAG: DUF1573 domain-containing protein [Bacteroidota bacterium]|nr:DUF1573 domain-containing protein [Bacteroidota bacterium]